MIFNSYGVMLIAAVIYLYYIKTFLMIFQLGNLRKASIGRFCNKQQN